MDTPKIFAMASLATTLSACGPKQNTLEQAVQNGPTASVVDETSAASVQPGCEIVAEMANVLATISANNDGVDERSFGDDGSDQWLAVRGDFSLDTEFVDDLGLGANPIVVFYFGKSEEFQRVAVESSSDVSHEEILPDGRKFLASHQWCMQRGGTSNNPVFSCGPYSIIGASEAGVVHENYLGQVDFRTEVIVPSGACDEELAMVKENASSLYGQMLAAMSERK